MAVMAKTRLFRGEHDVVAEEEEGQDDEVVMDTGVPGIDYNVWVEVEVYYVAMSSRQLDHNPHNISYNILRCMIHDYHVVACDILQHWDIHISHQVQDRASHMVESEGDGSDNSNVVEEADLHYQWLVKTDRKDDGGDDLVEQQVND
jgi:hypothetical protein